MKLTNDININVKKLREELNLGKSLKENIEHNSESAQKNNIEKEATALLNLNMFEKMDANKKFFGIK